MDERRDGGCKKGFKADTKGAKAATPAFAMREENVQSEQNREVRRKVVNLYVKGRKGMKLPPSDATERRCKNLSGCIFTFTVALCRPKEIDPSGHIRESA